MITALNVEKTFYSGKDEFSVLKGITLDLRVGQRIAVVGPSGVGKSCLLQLLSALDSPTKGSIFWDGRDISTMTEEQKVFWRRKNLGFVFQFYHLLPELSVVENVMFPLLLLGISFSDAKEQAVSLLGQFGLKDKIHEKVFVLSGGEMQRIAIVRAVIHKPSFIFADEPTGNLDENMKNNVWNFLFGMVNKYNIGLLAVTHSLDYLDRFDKVYILRAGKLYDYFEDSNSGGDKC